MSTEVEPLTLETLTRDRLDRIAQRTYGYTAGAVEALLAANRHLADQPENLPQGLVIVLPQLIAPTPQRVRLWT